MIFDLKGGVFMIKVYTLNAFTDDVSGGNPAGVVLDADNLTEKQIDRKSVV